MRPNEIHLTNQLQRQGKKAADRAIMIGPVKLGSEKTGTVLMRGGAAAVSVETRRRWILRRIMRVAATREEVQTLPGERDRRKKRENQPGDALGLGRHAHHNRQENGNLPSKRSDRLEVYPLRKSGSTADSRASSG